MSADRGDSPPAASAWNEYWRLAPDGDAHGSGSVLVEALSRFWSGLFPATPPRGPALRLLDFACGSGAVTGFALEAARTSGAPLPAIVGMDGAPAAVAAYRVRFPTSQAIVADVRHAPFADGAFDRVGSQFGLEYAGEAGVEEAARLVAPGGTLGAVLHCRDGAIHQECERNLRAVERVRASSLFPTAREAFRRGVTAMRGKGSQAEFLRAEERFAAAVNEVDGVLRDFGDGVAGGVIHRLYADLGRMYGRLAAYDPEEVGRWCALMEAELAAYEGRMAAMTAAAMDASGLDRVAARAVSRGLAVRTQEGLFAGTGAGEPAAWVLVCDRH